jgi:hypothetical protein
MDWVWLVSLAWLALALPVAVLVGLWLKRADLRDAEGRDARGRESPTTDRTPAGPPPPASVQHRRHRSHGRRRALHCPECRSGSAPPDRRSPGAAGNA